jgi:SAM-dependent methyltransferase
VADVAAHWEGVYATRPSTQLSWYEREPLTSLRLIEAFGEGPSVPVVDVGAGASVLVDRLLERGFGDVTVVDVSDRALTEVRERLGARSRRVTLFQTDLLTWDPDRQYGIWHDRALFHFLTRPADRDRYVNVAGRAVARGGILVLATFAADGPTRCSGLPVDRYSWEDLLATFSSSFSIAHHEREEHETPSGSMQPFTWVVLERAYRA